MEFNNEKKNINFINNIIIQAIIHGGDAGGPYCCNEEELYNSIKQLIIQNNLEHDYEIAFLRIDGYGDKFPQIVLKGELF
ncbi:MAG: hypothetical protein VZR33_03530 [Methanosphaera sp.]|nr:hypothetical protein [Methanosphaera sp.]